MNTTMTRAQARQADVLAMTEYGMPGLLLMENAARNAARVAIDLLPAERSRARVSILCGKGNNGGDGYAIARHLDNAGVNVTIYALADPASLQGDAKTNADIAIRMGLRIVSAADPDSWRDDLPALKQSSLIIDAMLGTGFTGQLRSPYDAAIHCCNQAHDAGVKVLAVDIPSGLDCDTGHVESIAIHADVTATFVAMKQGFVMPDAERYTGKVVVCDIGLPARRLVEGWPDA